MQPTDKPDNSENNSEQITNLLNEKNNLTTIIEQKKQVIQQLENKIRGLEHSAPLIKEVIKEVPVENKEFIRHLQTKLTQQKAKFTQLSYYCLFFGLASVFLLISLVKL